MFFLQGHYWHWEDNEDVAGTTQAVQSKNGQSGKVEQTFDATIGMICLEEVGSDLVKKLHLLSTCSDKFTLYVLFVIKQNKNKSRFYKI